MRTRKRKEDTKIGQLLDLALKYRYGDNFKWEQVNISRDDGNYIIEIVLPEKRIIKSPTKTSPLLPLIQRIVKTAPPKRNKHERNP